MQHLPLRVHLAMHGYRDRAMRLPETRAAFHEAQATGYPNSYYWADRLHAAQSEIDRRAYKEDIDQLNARYPDSWIEAQSFMTLALAAERVLAVLRANPEATAGDLIAAWEPTSAQPA